MLLLLIRKGADTLTRDEMDDAYYVITHIHQTLSCNVHGPYTDDKAQRLLTFNSSLFIRVAFVKDSTVYFVGQTEASVEECRFS